MAAVAAHIQVVSLKMKSGSAREYCGVSGSHVDGVDIRAVVAYTLQLAKCSMLLLPGYKCKL